MLPQTTIPQSSHNVANASEEYVSKGKGKKTLKGRKTKTLNEDNKEIGNGVKRFDIGI
jgi:hypothetical protein